MTCISTDKDLVTLINVFTVEPEDQQKLIDAAIKVTQEVISKQPGFISVNFHKSFDGTKVVNYSQWKTQKDLDYISNNQEIREALQETLKIAKKVEPNFYQVVYCQNK